MAEQNERRVILIGKSGAGKSATGNTILMRKGRKRFPVNSTYEQSTTECSTRQAFNKTMQLNYKVLDTPGLWKDTEALPEVGYSIQQQVIECCNTPHVFLLVVDPDDCHNTMQIAKVLQTWFGNTILDHTIVVFTKGTLFKNDEYFRDGVLRGKLDGLVDLFGSRIVRVENHGDGRAKSQQDLLSLIERSSRDGKAIFQFKRFPSLYQFKRSCNQSYSDHGYIKDALSEVIPEICHETKSMRHRGYFPEGNDDYETKVSDSKSEPTASGYLYNVRPKETIHATACYSSSDFVYEEETTYQRYAYGTKPKEPRHVKTRNTPIEVDSEDETIDPEYVYCTKSKESKSVVARYSPNDVGSEAESTEYEYVYGTKTVGESDASTYDSKPLMEKDVKKTIGCALAAGNAMVNIQRSPLTSLATLSVMASNEENREAIKNVVQSKEIQSVMETTWSFLTEAATTVGNFVTEVAQKVEEERIRKEREEARRRRYTRNFRY